MNTTLILKDDVDEIVLVDDPGGTYFLLSDTFLAPPPEPIDVRGSGQQSRLISRRHGNRRVDFSYMVRENGSETAINAVSRVNRMLNRAASKTYLDGDSYQSHANYENEINTGDTGLILQVRLGSYAGDTFYNEENESVTSDRIYNFNVVVGDQEIDGLYSPSADLDTASHRYIMRVRVTLECKPYALGPARLIHYNLAAYSRGVPPTSTASYSNTRIMIPASDIPGDAPALTRISTRLTDARGIILARHAGRSCLLNSPTVPCLGSFSPTATRDVSMIAGGQFMDDEVVKVKVKITGATTIIYSVVRGMDTAHGAEVNWTPSTTVRIHEKIPVFFDLTSRWRGDWVSGTSYTKSASNTDVVRYNGKYWACTSTNTANASNGPEGVASLWTDIGVGGATAWASGASYTAGNKVSFMGMVWESNSNHTATYWNRPGRDGSPWVVTGYTGMYVMFTDPADMVTGRYLEFVSTQCAMLQPMASGTDMGSALSNYVNAQNESGTPLTSVYVNIPREARGKYKMLVGVYSEDAFNYEFRASVEFIARDGSSYTTPAYYDWVMMEKVAGDRIIDLGVLDLSPSSMPALSHAGAHTVARVQIYVRFSSARMRETSSMLQATRFALFPMQDSDSFLWSGWRFDSQYRQVFSNFDYDNPYIAEISAGGVDRIAGSGIYTSPSDVDLDAAFVNPLDATSLGVPIVLVPGIDNTIIINPIKTGTASVYDNDFTRTYWHADGETNEVTISIRPRYLIAG